MKWNGSKQGDRMGVGWDWVRVGSGAGASGAVRARG